MLVYLTTKRFPVSTADHIYIRCLAQAFSQKVHSFVLVVSGQKSHDLKGVPTLSLPRLPLPRSLLFLLWFPIAVLARRWRSHDTVFFANDFNLLAIAVLWRPLLGARYRICSDWHLMTGTWRDRYVAKGSDRIITTSDRLRGLVIERTGVPAHRAQTVYGGVDPEAFTGDLPSRSVLGLPENTCLVGYVGLFRSLDHEKGLVTLIEALQYLPDTVHGVLVGGSEAEIAHYRAYAEHLAVSERTQVIPRQPHELVPLYQRSMDILVIPYPDRPHFRDYGFPMKAYEYICSGKPIAYSRLAILQEVLAPFGEAFVPEDAADLASVITHLRKRGSGGAPPDAVHAYSWDAKATSIMVSLGLG